VWEEERERVVEEKRESDKSCPKEQHNLSAILTRSQFHQSLLKNDEIDR